MTLAIRYRVFPTLLAALVALPVAARGQAPAPSLTLHEAVKWALDFHPELQAARAREREAAALVGEATARRLPQVSSQASLVRFQEPMIVRPFHSLDLSAPPDFERTLVQGNIGAQVTLFDGGERRARASGARAASRAASAVTAEAEGDLIADVTRRYLAVLAAASALEAQQSGIRALEAESLRVTQHFAQGRAARVQVLRVRAALAQAVAERVSAAERLRAAERNLAHIIGADVVETRAAGLVPVRLAADIQSPERDAVLRQVEASNTALRRARLQLEAARWGRRAAVSAWLPRLKLRAAYLGFGSTGTNLTAEWQTGVEVVYPIFTGGARSSAVQRAGWEVDAAEARYRAIRLRIAETADRMLALAAEAQARVAAVRAAVQHLEELVRIEALRLEEGAGTEADFLRAESQLRAARAQLIEARHSVIVSRVELARLTGELSPVWLQAVLEVER